MRNLRLQFSIRALLAQFVFLAVIMLVAANVVRNQRYETTTMIAISYPTPTTSFPFDDAFWLQVRQHPDVQDLLAIEKPLDTNAWLKSHFAVNPVKNSDILKLTVHRDRYQDVGALEEYPDLLEAIVEELREQAEAEGATVDIIQSPGMPINTSPLSMLR